MKEFLFPTGYGRDNLWDVEMIDDWVESKRRFLTFAFNLFFPHTLSDEIFWLYLYYTKSSTEIPRFQGKLRFRFRVINWGKQPCLGSAIYYYRSKYDARIWFLCDRFEEVTRLLGDMLTLDDFEHPGGKKLGSCLRNSIAPAVCKAEIKIKRDHP